MGTHISKVKSLSMDSWTTDQVEVSSLRGFCKLWVDADLASVVDDEEERECSGQ